MKFVFCVSCMCARDREEKRAVSMSFIRDDDGGGKKAAFFNKRDRECYVFVPPGSHVV